MGLLLVEYALLLTSFVKHLQTVALQHGGCIEARKGIVEHSRRTPLCSLLCLHL
jgi:hypothetical protein